MGIVLLALAASATSLTNRFAFDDVLLIAGDRRIHELAAPWRFFGQTYWPPAIRNGLYRPLTSLAFALEWRLGQGAPWVYHLANVLLYVAVCVAVYGLAKLVIGRTAGWWAAALFAVHPVHVEAVGNAVGQAELWAALLVVLAVGHYLGARRTRDLTGSDIAVLTAAYAAGCLFKEHAIVLPGLLLAAELTVLGGVPVGPAGRKGLRWLAVALGLTAIGFWSVHTLVTGGVAGDVPHPALRGLSHADRLLTMLGVVPTWVQLLVAPIHLKVDYSPQEVTLAHAFVWPQFFGALLLAGAGLGAARARRDRPALTFAAIWVAVSLLPTSNLVVPSGVLLAERTLFLPSVGAVLGLAVGVDWLVQRLRDRSARIRMAVAAAGVAVLSAGVVRSALRQQVWRNNRTFFPQMVIDAPRSYRGHWWQARRLFQAGNLTGAEREFRLALSLFPDDPTMLADAADHFSALNRCEDATPLYRRSLSLAPEKRWLHRRLIACLAKSGRTEEARKEAAAAVGRGDSLAVEALEAGDSLARAATAGSGVDR